MQIIDGAYFKVIEFDKGIVIVNALDGVNRTEARELIVANARSIGEYLLRYLHARANGKTQSEAHQQAIKDAVVVDRAQRNT